MSAAGKRLPAHLSRRGMLGAMLLGGGGLVLRSVATGLSTAFLTEGTASAEPAKTPTALLLSTCQSGDPFNVSTPGSMIDAGLRATWNATHGAATAAVDLQLGGRTYAAARPWAELPPALLARLGFIHHRTFAETHTEHEKVLRVFGALRGAAGNGTEMLPSAIAAEIAAGLGSLQKEPITLGEERVTYESRFVERLTPVELKTLFAGTKGKPDLVKLREETLDQIYRELKATGTKAQRTYLDRVATSRLQAAHLGEQLAVDLGIVPVDETSVRTLVPGLVADYELDAVDQVLTAVALLKYKITPAVTIHLPFGGDNHRDPGFAEESTDVQGGVRMFALVHQKLAEAGLADKVTFASLNTFGRTFGTADGRAHNSAHHVMAMFGPHVKGGVAGAPKKETRDWGAAGFDATTGAPGGGDVAEDKTFACAARTLMRACGVPDARIDVRLPGPSHAKNLVT